MATLRRTLQRRGPNPIFAFFALAIASFAGLTAGETRAQGLFLPFVGPTNQSMGGASVAAPIDSIGALNWNPASISGLQSPELAFGLGLVLPTTSLSSRVAANAFGPGTPPIDLTGSSDSEPGVTSVPSIGFVHREDDSPWTVGLGIFGIGGFSANYAASTTNPILTPQASAASPLGGLGRVYANAEFCQVVPTVSYALTDNFSLGFAPTLTLARLQVNPLVFAPPNDANGDGFSSYGPGDGTRTAWGGGFQLGAYYVTDSCWQWGVSYKSPQWFEPFRFRSQDEVGGPVVAKTNVDLPSIVSLGVAYAGYERWLFATDVRYFNFAEANGLGDRGFNPDGSVAGVGWKNIFSVSQGVQFLLTDRWTLRTGYTFNQNPIHDRDAMFNVASSLIIQHWYSLGATYQFNQNVLGTIAWTHGFENTVSGPFQSPFGPVPGTSVTERVSADILNAGLTVRF